MVMAMAVAVDKSTFGENRNRIFALPQPFRFIWAVLLASVQVVSPLVMIVEGMGSVTEGSGVGTGVGVGSGVGIGSGVGVGSGVGTGSGTGSGVGSGTGTSRTAAILSMTSLAVTVPRDA